MLNEFIQDGRRCRKQRHNARDIVPVTVASYDASLAFVKSLDIQLYYLWSVTCLEIPAQKKHRRNDIISILSILNYAIKLNLFLYSIIGLRELLSHGWVQCLSHLGHKIYFDCKKKVRSLGTEAYTWI